MQPVEDCKLGKIPFSRDLVCAGTLPSALPAGLQYLRSLTRKAVREAVHPGQQGLPGCCVSPQKNNRPGLGRLRLDNVHHGFGERPAGRCDYFREAISFWLRAT
jgi:hypothetical protein